MVLSFSELVVQNVSKFFVIIVGLFLLSGIINYLFIKFLKDKVSHPTYLFVSRILTYIIFIVGITLTLNKLLIVDIGATFATLGILSGLLLFPMIPILQNITAGFVIIFERPFKEDDIIEINNKLCKIKEISLRKTKMRALTGEIITVPNLVFITSNPIVNYTSGEFIKSMQTFDVFGKSDFKKIKEIIEIICSGNQNILPNVPKKKRNLMEKMFAITNGVRSEKDLNRFKPRVFIKAIGKDKITIEVWFWIWDILQKEKITSAFYESVIQEFENNKVLLA